jgi:hypothetical protein
MSTEEHETASAEKGASFQDALAHVAKKLSERSFTKEGQIIFHLSGQEGATFCLDCAPGKTAVSEGFAGRAQRVPLVEVMGDASVIRAIIEDKKDGLKQFREGNLRIRGDLRYFSDLILELGIIKSPL